MGPKTPKKNLFKVIDANFEPFKTSLKIVIRNKSSSEDNKNSNLYLHYLNCMYTNADSLWNKIYELKIRLNSKSTDDDIGIIGITEGVKILNIWLKYHK